MVLIGFHNVPESSGAVAIRKKSTPKTYCEVLIVTVQAGILIQRSGDQLSGNGRCKVYGAHFIAGGSIFFLTCAFSHHHGRHFIYGCAYRVWHLVIISSAARNLISPHPHLVIPSEARDLHTN